MEVGGGGNIEQQETKRFARTGNPRRLAKFLWLFEYCGRPEVANVLATGNSAVTSIWDGAVEVSKGRSDDDTGSANSSDWLSSAGNVYVA